MLVVSPYVTTGYPGTCTYNDDLAVMYTRQRPREDGFELKSDYLKRHTLLSLWTVRNASVLLTDALQRTFLVVGCRPTSGSTPDTLSHRPDPRALHELYVMHLLSAASRLVRKNPAHARLHGQY